MIIRLVNANLGKADNIETDVATWGELKTLDRVQDFISGNVKAVVRENRTTLESDQAELPTEDLSPEKDYDFSLFFITKKSKAGLFGGSREEPSSEGCRSQSQLDRIEEKVDYVYNAVKAELEGQKGSPELTQSGPTADEESDYNDIANEVS